MCQIKLIATDTIIAATTNNKERILLSSTIKVGLSLFKSLSSCSISSSFLCKSIMTYPRFSGPEAFDTGRDSGCAHRVDQGAFIGDAGGG
jgi:hypothetical protein